jgi:hypothetical protein
MIVQPSKLLSFLAIPDEVSRKLASVYPCAGVLEAALLPDLRNPLQAHLE